MPDSLTHADSILINATPEQVFAVVSDVTRTGEWSPVCEACWWDEGDGPRPGAFFTGRNVTPDRTWETRCEVTVCEAGRAFGWGVTEGNVFWTYTMRPVGSSTELTESWEFTAKGQAFFAQRFGADAAAEVEKRRQAAQEGIPVTLRAMKRIIEESDD
ncbi:SRPBCC family protein [Leucobacter tenebrionis]|uniref:SRPBCC family protein n=1 Tax=Leucobacter tenebrionis TaxID=2873270 RepID=UPI001CA6AC43|nr:SRPBCC family protein [Leucobacter tenebrionis]QZY52381.1 SRPBCC family protein [Leucobacter tenebrionis]